MFSLPLKSTMKLTSFKVTFHFYLVLLILNKKYTLFCLNTYFNFHHSYSNQLDILNSKNCCLVSESLILIGELNPLRKDPQPEVLVSDRRTFLMIFSCSCSRYFLCVCLIFSSTCKESTATGEHLSAALRGTEELQVTSDLSAQTLLQLAELVLLL